MRLEAEAVLGPAAVVEELADGVRPLLLVPFALGAAGVVALGGLGLLSPLAMGLLDLGAALCYLLALRSALPTDLPVNGRRWALDVEVALVPLSALAAGASALVEGAQGPWNILVPIWIFVVLALGPWLDAQERAGSGPDWGPTLLSGLLVTIPAPCFAIGTAAGAPAPVVATSVAVAAVVPAWRLVRLAGRSDRYAWTAAGWVAAVMGVAAALTVRIDTQGALLPAALLLAWYGLAGVSAQAGRRPRGSFAGFVVLAAALLAITAPA